MSATKIARDPAEILRELPDGERDHFLVEYQAAAEAAVHDVTRYEDLQRVLQRWSVIAVAVNQPGYDDAVHEARSSSSPGTSLADIQARRRSVAR